MTNKAKQYGLWAGLLLCSAIVASANTLVTFRVDMSNAGIDPNTEAVSAHGSFNGWGAFALTNDLSGSNPYLYSGTADVAANGSVMEYKYVSSSLPNSGYETIPKGANRLANLPATSGASLVLPKVYYADNTLTPVTVDVTFQVDMAQQINVGAFDPNSSSVYPKGTWNGWGTPDVMTNNPTILRTNQYGLVTSNVYVYTYSVTRSPGETLDFKFYIDTGDNYESPAPGTGDPSDHNNRFFNLSEGPTQAFPLVFFSDSPYGPLATNDVTFQVDMTGQVVLGNFDPTTGTVEVRGDFNNWGGVQVLCTNDPVALNTNLYKAVVRIADGVGATRYYKFWASVSANSGWETMANNRYFSIISGTAQILPAVYFSDVIVDPNDYLPADTLVTFRVNMTNAVAYPSGTAFDPTINAVYFNGDCLTNGWYGTWGGLWPETLLYDDGTHGDTLAGDYICTFQYLVPKGKAVRVQYKYGIDSNDNEAASGSDHVRYIRMAGTYVMPIDTFGSIVDNEPAPGFGNLTVGPESGGHVLVSWLGRPGVFLQTSTDLSNAASWVTHLESAAYGSPSGIYSTNYPTTTGATFFRLVKP
jgi:hypothetical protein